MDRFEEDLARVFDSNVELLEVIEAPRSFQELQQLGQFKGLMFLQDLEMKDEAEFVAYVREISPECVENGVVEKMKLMKRLKW